MLKVKNITKKYGELLAVDNLSFEVNDGEIFGLLGENGAGKTTTFRVIMGLLEPNNGEVLLNGNNIDYNVTDEIGFVTEERSLLTKLTVQEQIEFYGTLKGLTKEEIEKRLDKWLERFEIKSYKNRKIKELSKGNQQKVQFISAVIHEPKLLILDEPFTGLDPINVKLIKEAIIELKEKGCSIIFSSHQMEYIEDFCEKLIILVKGKPILEGNIDDIKENYAKKNILIRGNNLEINKLNNIKGVISINKVKGEYEIKVENKNVAPKIFEIVKQWDITKYDVVEPTLNEIFIESVGGIHE